MSCEEKGRKQKFEIACPSRGFHAYSEIWKPELGQILQVRQKIGNLQGLFAISPGAKIPGKLTDFHVAGHIHREISRFCHHFSKYKLEARV